MTASSSCQAMVLAAGRGERMRPLTDACPKPLLQVQGRALIDYPLGALAEGGFDRVVVNVAWLGERIRQHLGEAPERGEPPRRMSIRYSDEARDFGGALETAGGIVRALPSLEPVFWVCAADIHAPGFRFRAQDVQAFERSGLLARIWLVPNPAQHPGGDFGIDAAGMAVDAPAGDATRRTFSTIGLYRRELFEPPFCDIPCGNPEGLRLPLAPVLRAAMARRLVGATLFEGAWADVGTPERLAALNAEGRGESAA